MLVLTRKLGEKIMIGDEIVVTLVRIQGDKIRLGIDAPPSVVVLREELAARKTESAAAPQMASSLGDPNTASRD